MTDPTDSLAAFPRERTWLLPALRAAQQAERWLSPETLDRIAAHLRVPKSEVWGVASHYPELRLARPGRRIVRVCTGVSCRVVGGRELLAACEQRLGVRAGQTSADGAEETDSCLEMLPAITYETISSGSRKSAIKSPTVPRPVRGRSQRIKVWSLAGATDKPALAASQATAT